jgi:hypothetical protein
MKLWALALFVLMGCNSAGGSSGLPLEVGDRYIAAGAGGGTKRCAHFGHTVEAVVGSWIQYTDKTGNKIWTTPHSLGGHGIIICPK